MTTKKKQTKSKKPAAPRVAKQAASGGLPRKAKIKIRAVRPAATPAPRRSSTGKAERMNQFTFMRAPGIGHGFQVGGPVEVYCDHEKNAERVRGWIKGIVVQVDNKMVAVQFRSNVFLTDGWMVPDRILWYPVISEHIRPVLTKKAVSGPIPDY